MESEEFKKIKADLSLLECGEEDLVKRKGFGYGGSEEETEQKSNLTKSVLMELLF